MIDRKAVYNRPMANPGSDPRDLRAEILERATRERVKFLRQAVAKA